jgi:signal transduction histidine kinase
MIEMTDKTREVQEVFNDLPESTATLHDEKLYFDILRDKSPEAMFDFGEAAARNMNLAQKNLFFMGLRNKAQALTEANAQLQEKDRIRDEYVSRVTHDIKGHLAAIRSCLSVVADKSAGKFSEKQADFLGRAINRTNQLTNFLKELLDLTQTRLSGRMEMEAFYLPDTIDKAIETVSRRVQDKSISLTCNVARSVEQVLGNEFSINEVLTNLLFNAIKYTPQGKSVHLEASTCDEYIQVDVVDTGIGIPADEIGNVFDEFFRASNAKKSEKDGTGLGLSLVKQIVERHGGTISVQSEEGKGSTLTVRLAQHNPGPA